jgi:hypothetical protein
VKAMKGLKLAPGSSPGYKRSNNGGGGPVYVRVAMAHNKQEVHEFPTDTNGNLSFLAVSAVYPGNLKYCFDDYYCSNFYLRCHFVQRGSTICFVVVLLVVVLLLLGESLIKILLYSPILFNFTMLLQQ